MINDKKRGFSFATSTLVRASNESEIDSTISSSHKQFNELVTFYNSNYTIFTFKLDVPSAEQSIHLAVL